MKKFFLLTLSLILTPALIAVCAIFLSFLAFQKEELAFLSIDEPRAAYAAIPGQDNFLQSEIFHEDGRIEIVRRFFTKYNSDLVPYSRDVVNAADRYGIDFRLIPAIGMHESQLCLKAPKDSHNCWGFGIYGKKVTRFDNYGQAIDAVTKTLARDYIGQGLTTTEQIMSKYTPSSEGSWAKGVNFFINQLQ